MSRGVPNKRYTPEFKQKVVETILNEGLSYKEAQRQFEIWITTTTTESRQS